MKVSTKPKGKFDIYMIGNRREWKPISFSHIKKVLTSENALALVVSPHDFLQDYTLNSTSVLIAYHTGTRPRKGIWEDIGFAVTRFYDYTAVRLSDYGTWTPGTVAADTFQ